MSDTEDPVVANRRSRLKLWIDTNCAGSQKLFIASTNDGEKQVNQGELSGLLRSKSFGEKRARSLERQAHMPIGYLDLAISESQLTDQSPATNTQISNMDWPFRKITKERFTDLKIILGNKKFNLALEDIEELIEVAILKWERRAATDDKSSAA